MRTLVLKSGEVRKQWRSMLDAALAGTHDTMISRNGKIIAAVIPAVDYEALKEELAVHRAERRASEAFGALDTKEGL